MAKRKNQGKGRGKGSQRQKKPKAAKLPAMTEEKIAEVKTWLERMRVHAEKAISLSERISPRDMSESNDLFWSLAKYVENVEESAVQLDNINKDIYSELIELEEGLWQDLKGMRSRLAHAFWDIDPEILQETVKTDFPLLLSLLSTMIVIEKPIDDNEQFSFQFETELLLGLPDAENGSITEAGNSLVVMAFGYNGRVGVFRIGHVGTQRLVTKTNFDTQFSVYGRLKSDPL